MGFYEFSDTGTHENLSRISVDLQVAKFLDPGLCRSIAIEWMVGSVGEDTRYSEDIPSPDLLSSWISA